MSLHTSTHPSRRHKPVIAFLTDFWTNIDDRIREGKRPGGTASVWRIWEECQNEGFEVHVFVVAKLPDDWPKQTTALGGVVFHWIREPLLGLTQRLQKLGLQGIFTPHWPLRQAAMAWRLLTCGVRPNILYMMRRSFLLVGLAASCLLRAKRVVRLYGTWIYHLWFTQRKWRPRLKEIGGLAELCLPADLLIMTNDGTSGEKAARWVGVDMRKFRFWLNGTDKAMHVAEFDAAGFKKKLGMTPNDPMLMTLGRLADWKRQDRLIDAMPAIVKEYPAAKLFLVGGGPMRDALEQRARSTGVGESVVFVGAVGHDQIREYLNACDVYAQAFDVSNLSNTLIEALTAGCCIVTRDVGSTTELVTDGQNAVVLRPGEADEYAEAILRLLRNPDERQRLARAAYEYAMKHFQTWEERMAMEVRELRNLLPKCKASSKQPTHS
ncbi:MAG: glycosyltransferase family 4 protein [Phycisphaerae bacterium]|nr:glycosyltransferase family 4 protein [Phycisphaerae bacterium]